MYVIDPVHIDINQSLVPDVIDIGGSSYRVPVASQIMLKFSMATQNLASYPTEKIETSNSLSHRDIRQD